MCRTVRSSSPLTHKPREYPTYTSTPTPQKNHGFACATNFSQSPPTNIIESGGGGRTVRRIFARLEYRIREYSAHPCFPRLRGDALLSMLCAEKLNRNGLFGQSLKVGGRANPEPARSRKVRVRAKTRRHLVLRGACFPDFL